MKIADRIVAGLLLAAGGLLLSAELRWRRKTAALVRRLGSGGSVTPPVGFHSARRGRIVEVAHDFGGGD
jgi:hypothetical protein